MIGIGLKKLANQNGMTVSSGVAYGSLKGYATTMFEGSGYKKLIVTTKFADPTQAVALEAFVKSVDIKKEYRVLEFAMEPKAIHITFLDNPGTMAKIEAFIEWFYPLLPQYGASAANCCMECGQPTAVGSWYLIDGAAYFYHESCGSHVAEQIAGEEKEKQEKDDGSYVQGLIGALLGAVLGAVAWILLLLAGYVSSLVGLLMGWLAEKGYTLLHGKQGKGKIWILILAVIFGVFVGTMGAEYVSVVQAINDGTLAEYTVAEVPDLLLTLLIYDSEYQTAILANIGQGLLFAALGVFIFLRNTNKAVAGVQVKKLN